MLSKMQDSTNETDIKYDESTNSVQTKIQSANLQPFL